MPVILPFTHCSMCSVIDIYIYIYRCYAVVLDHLLLWAKQMCLYIIYYCQYITTGTLVSACQATVDIFGLKKSGISAHEPVSAEIFFYLFKSQERNGAFVF